MKKKNTQLDDSVESLQRAWVKCTTGGEYIAVSKKKMEEAGCNVSIWEVLCKTTKDSILLGPVNKVGLLSSRKTAFTVGFVEGISYWIDKTRKEKEK